MTHRVRYWSDTLKIDGAFGKVRPGDDLDDVLNEVCDEIEDLLRSHGFFDARVYREGDPSEVCDEDVDLLLSHDSKD